jgi:hypothetical protein
VTPLVPGLKTLTTVPYSFHHAVLDPPKLAWRPRGIPLMPLDMPPKGEVMPWVDVSDPDTTIAA